MKRITIKALGIILTVAMLLAAVPATAFAKELKNPYENILFGSSADEIKGKHTLHENGAIALNDAGATLKFENLDFYKNTTHLIINYATPKTYVTPRKFTIRLDDPQKGTLLGTFQLDGTATVTSAALNYMTMTFELTANISGIHDLYITDLEGSTVVLRYFKFSGAWEEGKETVTSYPTEIEILNGLGIADYSYAKAGTLDKPITRRAFSRMVSKLFKVKDISNITFYDVPETDPDVKDIAAMYALGVMKADNGYFYPENTLSLEEAYKILLTIMGFELKTNASYKGRWSLMANEAGLNAGVKGNLASALTYYDAIQICENALYISLPQVLYPSLDVSFPQSDERTVLYSIHKTVKAQGIVKATSMSYLSTHTATTSPTQVRIGDNYYNYEDKRINDYLGYDVVYYYKNEGGVKTVVCAYPSSKNKVKVIDAKDIAGYNNRVLSYKTGVITKKISFTNTTDVLFNGVSYQAYTEEDFYPEEGSITFIDNNSSGGYDVVRIISGTNYIAESIDAVYGIIALTPVKEGEGVRSSVATSDSSVVNLQITLKGDNEARVTDINNGDVITVYESKPYNGMIQNLKIEVSDEVFQETIVEMNTKDGKQYVTSQSGAKYELSRDCNRDITVGLPYIFHVAPSGKVVWLEIGNNRDYKYGYAMNVGVKNGAWKSSFQIKMLTEANKIEILDCAQKLTFDGDVITGVENQKNRYILNSVGEENLNTKVYVKMDDGSIRWIPQTIRYKTNKDGEIYFIDTVVVGANEDAQDLTKVVAVNNSIVSSYYLYRAPVDENTVVFKTPIVYSTNAKTLVKRLDAAKDTGFVAGPQFKYAANNLCEGYDGDALTPLKALTQYTASTDKLPGTITWFFVTGVATGLDRNGEETKILSVITKGTTADIVLNHAMYNKYGSKMKVGDLWVYRTDTYNEVSLMYPLWSIDGTDVDPADEYDIRQKLFVSGSNKIWYVPEILDKNKTWYEVDTAHYKNQEGNKTYGYNQIREKTGLNFSGANIMSYNMKTGEVKKLATDEVPTTEQITASETGITKQHMFVLLKSSAIKQIIIVRE